MINGPLKAIGRTCYYLDRLYEIIWGKTPAEIPDSELDKTGRLMGTPEPLHVSYHDDDLAFVHYPGRLAHSSWRSQELNLFRQHRDLLRRPRADFGCGDGSFSRALLEVVDIGIDYDLLALRVARGYGIYSRLICCNGAAIPLRESSVWSIYSNSVLEHVDGIERVMRELHRILAPGGLLAFTVPVSAFAQHIARYYGQAASDRLNRRFFHRNLHPGEWWESLLAKCGFEVVELKHYQPDWFTFYYVFFSTRVFSLFQRTGIAARTLHRKAAKMVAQSASQPSEGGNIFVVARKKTGQACGSLEPK